MAKDDLETRVKKAVIKIEKSVSGIYTAITDFGLKLNHVIERSMDRYSDGPCPYYSN